VKFIDEAIITVQSGDGGRGCVSFKREKFIPRGGPDGGDGGKGGDVIFQAVSGKRTLYQFRYKKNLKAKNGGYGQGKNKTGKKGADLVIDIPVGTLITDAETGNLLKDFTTPGTKFILAYGGRGGQGNARFKTSTNRAPKFAQPGEPCETYRIKLELKLLADVGIIGLPNAGKSTLISAISSARPKIAGYPFTTLTPSLGVVHTDWGEPFIAADIPGLIEGAHKGHGLGVRFLKHIERTRILIHLIDISEIDPDAPLKAYNTINTELFLYNQSLAKKPQIIALNKIDMQLSDDAELKFKSALPDKKIISISALTGKGIDSLKSKIINLLGIEDEQL
jgi:GTP-binding protein